MITVELKFQDSNMPSIKADCSTLEEAQTEGHIMLNQFASVKCLILHDDNGKSFFNANGDYMCTIQSGG